MGCQVINRSIASSKNAHFTCFIIVVSGASLGAFGLPPGSLLFHLRFPGLSDLICQPLLPVDKRIGTIVRKHSLMAALQVSLHLRYLLALLTLCSNVRHVRLVQMPSLLVEEVALLLLSHLETLFDLSKHVLLLPHKVFFALLFALSVG